MTSEEELKEEIERLKIQVLKFIRISNFYKELRIIREKEMELATNENEMLHNELNLLINMEKNNSSQTKPSGTSCFSF